MALTKVGTNVIKDSAVTTAKIADGAVGTADIADGAITTAKIADGTITAADLVMPSCISKATTTNAPTTNGATVTFTDGYNVSTITRGATAGLYTITLGSGNATYSAAFTPMFASAGAGVRITSVSGSQIGIQAYVGATPTDMQFSFFMV